MNVLDQLRKKFDGTESFIAGGHSVAGAKSTLYAERVARTPDWVNNDAEVRSLILKVFPKWETNERQRKRASRWVYIIYEYFRRGRVSGDIADSLGMTNKQLTWMITRIRWAHDGLTREKKPRGQAKKGRPKKKREVIHATNEGRDLQATAIMSIS